MGVIYYKCGTFNAGDFEEQEQFVGIDSETFKIVDDEGVIFADEIPDLSKVTTQDELESAMTPKWERCVD